MRLAICAVLCTWIRGVTIALMHADTGHQEIETKKRQPPFFCNRFHALATVGTLWTGAARLYPRETQILQSVKPPMQQVGFCFSFLRFRGLGFRVRIHYRVVHAQPHKQTCQVATRHLATRIFPLAGPGMSGGGGAGMEGLSSRKIQDLSP